MGLEPEIVLGGEVIGFVSFVLPHHEGHHLLIECVLMVLISSGALILLLDME